MTNHSTWYSAGRTALRARRPSALDDLKPERFLLRSHCEKCSDLAAVLRAKGLNADHRHEVSSDQDLLALLEANIGIGFLPRTVKAPQSLVRTAVNGLELGRDVCLYGVAGRQRTPVAATFMKMLRAANWPKDDLVEFTSARRSAPQSPCACDSPDR